MSARKRTLFINSGILGQKTFSHFAAKYFAQHPQLEVHQIILSQDLTLVERMIRRVMCQRFWRDGWFGIRNADFARFRQEYHAGFQAARRIRKFERLFGQSDVLHFHRQATAYASISRIRKTPTIVSIDCTQSCVANLSTTRWEARSYYPNIRRDGLIFDAADLIMSASNWAARCAQNEYPDCKNPIEVMPNPVELDQFDSEWAPQRLERSRAPHYRPRVLFIGGHFPRKGGPELATAWALGKFNDRADLDLVTDWPIGTSPGDGINLLRGVKAHSPAWKALWRAADVFVMPTRDEAFGMVYQEAGAAGLPAIGTRLNAIPEIILEDETGILVPPGDQGALISALDRLISSAELRCQFGLKARRHIVATASPESYRDRLSSFLVQLAESPKGGFEHISANTAAFNISRLKSTKQERPIRALFVNSGILGHKSVVKLIREATADASDLDARHLDLSTELTAFDRILRRVLCFHPISSNYDLARWRSEFHSGLLCRRRIARLEKRGHRFDLYHFHPQPLGYCNFDRMRSTPTIVSIDATQHLAASEGSRREQWTFRPSMRHDRAVFERAAAIICTSRWAANHVAEINSTFQSKSLVLPYPISLDRFPATWLEDRFERSRGGNYKPNVLFIGGDFPRKGGFDLLRAWTYSDLHRLARMTLVTSWPLKPGELPPEVRHLNGVSAYSDDWFRCWHEADLFVLPTTSEAFGMVFQEAAAAALPVVGTNVAAIPEIVLDGKTGILATPGDISSITSAIRQLLKSPELRKEMGRNARNHMTQFASPKTYSRELLDLIRKLAVRK